MKLLKSKLAIAATAFGLAAASTSASAAVPTEVTDMITGLGTDAGTLFAACVGLWVIIRGSIGIMRLGNRFISRAGS